MAPLLIDGRDFIKYGIITVLTTAFIFAGGVFYGYKSAFSFYLAGSDSEPLLLPVKTAAAGKVREPKVPETIVAGADIDVDQPDPVSAKDAVAGNNSATAQSEITTPVIIKQSSINEESDIVAAVVDTKADEAANRITETKKVEVSPGRIKPQQLQANNSQLDKSSGQRKDLKANVKSMDISTLTADELDKIKYSVQVGMYGRLANAENMVKQLQANDFDAYVSGFTNKKNETRYNVRFGYFPNKQTARSALKQYRQSRKADGYPVKFTADSVTRQSLDRLVKNRQPARYDLDENKTEPAAEEFESDDDKLSRADSINIEKMIEAHGKVSQTITATN